MELLSYFLTCGISQNRLVYALVTKLILRYWLLRKTNASASSNTIDFLPWTKPVLCLSGALNLEFSPFWVTRGREIRPEPRQLKNERDRNRTQREWKIKNLKSNIKMFKEL